MVKVDKLDLGIKGSSAELSQDDDSAEIIKDLKLVRLEAFDFFEWIITRLTTSATEKPSTPTLEIKNPYKKDILISNLGFVPDANFKLNGSLEIIVNDVPKVRGKSAGTFTDTDVINVPIPEGGLLLKKDKSIQIRIWTSTGTVFLTTSIAVGDFE